MRNLLFVLVFISITVLGCGWFKSPMENCTDEKYKLSGIRPSVLKKSYKEKMQDHYYSYLHEDCEKKRMVAPKTFDVKYQ